MRVLSFLISARVMAGTFLLASPSVAAPATQSSFDASVGFRYGFPSGDSRWNPFGAGLGLDLGYTLKFPVHLGGTLEYFFGSERESDGLVQTSRSLHVLGQGGYDLGLGERFVLRPELGIGLARVRDENCQASANCSHSNLNAGVVAAGMKLIWVTPGPSVTLGARYELMFHEFAAAAVVISAGVGF